MVFGWGKKSSDDSKKKNENQSNEKQKPQSWNYGEIVNENEIAQTIVLTDEPEKNPSTEFVNLSKSIKKYPKLK